MTDLLILGAGTAGTMVANRLRAQLDASWQVTVVDVDDRHHYQPGYLFVPFGSYAPQRVEKSRRAQLADGVIFVEGEISRVDSAARSVLLTDGRALAYDWLVIASGTRPRPEQVRGLTDPSIWYAESAEPRQASAFDFYTLEGATALRDALAAFEGGRLLVHVSELPIKCPVAPLEFAFLADDFFRRRGIRHKVDITYVTPLDGAFTKPVASAALGGLLDDRSVRLAADFAVERVNPESKRLVAFDGRELPFDLLVTVPPNMGQQFVIDSGLGDDMGFVPVDKHTMRSEADERIFVIGDASNVPTSKAGSVAHFQVDHFAENFELAVEGKPLTSLFDGHANCFVETGRGKGLLLDFNYETEPLTGVFPYPGVGPLRLLGESRLNHLGKLAFEQIYWHLLLPGRPLPVPTVMSMRGKRLPALTS
ncbi:type III sulfide quinone reductase, selenoprotein subtype [Granulicoccus sp. GXG6511]|uniref:type III sulfide quinone reductase, selenoprotein subtype n=1 Tax=Granulicoccus sp. GXG6511 TaxID=3381351 RepID=UPI003D7E77A2